MVVEQVELHPRTERFLQIGEVASLRSVAIVDGDGTVGGVGLDDVGINAADDATHIVLVDAMITLALFFSCRQ